MSGIIVLGLVFGAQFNYKDLVNFTLLSLLDVSVDVIKGEYVIYMLILQQSFENLFTHYARVMSRNDKNMLHINHCQRMYIELCHLAEKVLKLLWYPLVVIIIESVLIVTLHSYNLISKYYHSKNTNFWFFDIKYSIPWLIEYSLALATVVVPSLLCIRSANKIKKIFQDCCVCSTNLLISKNIQLFALQIIHEGFKIGMAGSFSIDLELVYTRWLYHDLHDPTIIAREYLVNVGIPVIYWPAVSPGMIPIENVWDYHHRMVRTQDVVLVELQGLEDALWSERI
ncbi:hypothetical protein Trydic_g6291 [Trypoxylus dichotomus]